jgi:hypothetical protein
MARKNPHAVALGRRGGQVRSAKKAAAVRRNAKMGGRKPKFQVGDRARGNEHAPNEYRDRVGTITGVGPSKSEYRIDYDDDGQPYGYLMSWWLDPEPSRR